MAKSPETSNHTSIKERISPQFNLGEAIKEQIELGVLIKFELPIKPLLRFEGAAINSEQDGILFSTIAYLELIDLTGRYIRDDKRGAIPMHLPPILQRLDVDKKAWLVNGKRPVKHTCFVS